jgi:hypothetical protein
MSPSALRFRLHALRCFRDSQNSLREASSVFALQTEGCAHDQHNYPNRSR